MGTYIVDIFVNFRIMLNVHLASKSVGGCLAQCTFSLLSCLINWEPDRQWTHLHFYTCQTLKLLNNGVKSKFMDTEMNLQTLIFWSKVLLFMMVVEFDLNSIISTSWTVLSKWMTFATIKLNGMTNNIEGCLIAILFGFEVGFLNVSWAILDLDFLRCCF